MSLDPEDIYKEIAAGKRAQAPPAVPAVPPKVEGPEDVYRAVAAGERAPLPKTSSVPDDWEGTLREAARKHGLVVTNAKRTPGENRRVGGAVGSYHLRGQALDIGGDPAKMRKLAEELRDTYGAHLTELYHGDIGIKHGKPSRPARDHADHVHVAWGSNKPATEARKRGELYGPPNVSARTQQAQRPTPNAQRQPYLKVNPLANLPATHPGAVPPQTKFDGLSPEARRAEAARDTRMGAELLIGTLPIPGANPLPRIALGALGAGLTGAGGQVLEDKINRVPDAEIPGRALNSGLWGAAVGGGAGALAEAGAAAFGALARSRGAAQAPAAAPTRRTPIPPIPFPARNRPPSRPVAQPAPFLRGYDARPRLQGDGFTARVSDGDVYRAVAKGERVGAPAAKPAAAVPEAAAPKTPPAAAPQAVAPEAAPKAAPKVAPVAQAVAPEAPKPPAPVQPEAPVAAPKPEAETTGLSRQAQEQELATIAPPKSGVTRTAVEAHGAGKQAVEAGEIDPEALARTIGQGDRPFNWKEAGALLEGKRRMLQTVNAAKATLDKAIQDGSPDAPRLRDEYEAQQAKLLGFVENVQKGSTEWHNTGMAIQALTTVNEADFAEVAMEAARKKGAKLNPSDEAKFKALTDQIAERDALLAAAEAEVKKLQAASVTVAEARKARKSNLKSLDQEFDEIWREVTAAAPKVKPGPVPPKPPPGSRTGGVSIPSVEYDHAAMKRAAGRLALNRVKRAGGTLDDVGRYVIEEFAARGIHVTAEQVIDDISELTKGKPRTQTEIQKQLSTLKREAKADVRTRMQIADLERRLRERDFIMPTRKEQVVSGRLLTLRAERDLLRRQVQAGIDGMKPKTLLDHAATVTGAVRGTVLGSDAGVLTRQGLFAWSRPVTASKAVGQGARAAVSETEMAKWELSNLKRNVGGQSVATAAKAAGLQTTDTIIKPEELVIGKLLQRIPIAGPLGAGLERFQTTFINSVRWDLFEQAMKERMRPDELKLRAQFINSSTGRGNVANVPKILSVIMTSPRYEASRWEMLWQPFKNAGVIAADLATGKGLNKAAKANLQDMAVAAAGIYSLYKGAELAGYQVGWDPDSSDFLGLRRGNEIWQPLPGVSQRMRDVIRLYVAMSRPDSKTNIREVVGKAAMRTVSPGVRTPLEQGSIALQRARGVTQPKSPFVGFKSDEDREGLITLAPLIYQSMREALKEEGPDAAAWTGSREFIGQSVNRYPPPKRP